MTRISARSRRVLGDEATLRRWYVERGMSLAEIGRRIGVTGSTVSAALRRHGIAVRAPGARSRSSFAAVAGSEADIHRRLADDPWERTQRLVTTRVEPWNLLVGADRLGAQPRAQ